MDLENDETLPDKAFYKRVWNSVVEVLVGFKLGHYVASAYSWQLCCAMTLRALVAAQEPI